jgi:hypothetical protein
VWRVYPVEGCHCTQWLTGLWSTQAKVEGIVLKAAWHWGSDSSVVNDPLWEQGRTPLYVAFCPPYVFPHFEEGSFIGDSSRR